MSEHCADLVHFALVDNYVQQSGFRLAFDNRKGKVHGDKPVLRMIRDESPAVVGIFFVIVVERYFPAGFGHAVDFSKIFLADGAELHRLKDLVISNVVFGK